jgi:ADP-ribosylglycohydrolase
LGGVTLDERVLGCLLGGACGDALGAPVEFVGTAAIERRYGPAGVRELEESYGVIGAITDDTQMTLFTAEGLIRNAVRATLHGIGWDPALQTHKSLLRWLLTQGERAGVVQFEQDGWLLEQDQLHARRAPGNTCLAALRGARELAQAARNDSKGCGGVMRVAPVGLFFYADAELAFTEGCKSAALTHGHQSGIGAAGAMAMIVALVCQGQSLSGAMRNSIELLRKQPGMNEVTEALQAVQYASSGDPVTAFGEGWVAEEALAIGLFGVLSTGNLEDAVVKAVSHGGDSDSTGSIAGQIAGALYGPRSIPARWLRQLELRNVIEQVASDLVVAVRHDYSTMEELFARYPA